MPYLNNQPIANELPRNPGYPRISEQLNSIGGSFQNIRTNIPHVVIGQNNNQVTKPNNPRTRKPKRPVNNNLPEPSNQQKVINYAFWIAIFVVGAYFAYRLIKLFFFS